MHYFKKGMKVSLYHICVWEQEKILINNTNIYSSDQIFVLYPYSCCMFSKYNTRSSWKQWKFPFIYGINLKAWDIWMMKDCIPTQPRKLWTKWQGVCSQRAHFLPMGVEKPKIILILLKSISKNDYNFILLSMHHFHCSCVSEIRLHHTCYFTLMIDI